MTTIYHPILFSTPMVQGIDENRKTQTRRTKGLELFNENPERWRYDGISEIDGGHYMELITVSGEPTENYFESKCPYNIGDVFWVRENFYTAENWDHLKPSLLKKYDINVYYKSDIGNENIPQLLHKGKMRPNIFLPAAYARTFLKIKSIRAERLQDISETDAIAEGVFYDKTFKLYSCYLCEKLGHTEVPLLCEDGFYDNAFESFRTLWKSINGIDSWNKNPFVWVYEFEKIDKPEDFGQ